MPKINLPQGESHRTVNSGKTFIARDIKRTAVMLDINGNQIDPRTKQIIKRNSETNE